MAASFETGESVSAWNLSLRDYLIKHGKDKEWHGIATANCVFNSTGQILLIQRAAHDSMPNRWELPGGAVDDDDVTILHGAARELIEESGLIAARFTGILTDGSNDQPGRVFNTSNGNVICQFTFLVEAENCEKVKLDPNEHQDFAWLEQQEVVERKKKDGAFEITKEGVAAIILQAFERRKD